VETNRNTPLCLLSTPPLSSSSVAGHGWRFREASSTGLSTEGVMICKKKSEADSHRDHGRSSDIRRRELGVEPLLLCVERSPLRWFGHLIRTPPGRLPLEVFQVPPTGRRPRGRPRTRWRDSISRLACDASGSHTMSWNVLRVRGKSGSACRVRCPRDPTPG